ncbi:MAG: hypothetical protein HY926_14210 [Elusimicrobia bacterium]|nr:hypothetical protein [Elusimicrobiota bacterium]
MITFADSAPCPGATLSDLSTDHIRRFSTIAQSRGFPLPPDAAPKTILNHLSLTTQDQPTNAAILLFGYDPQQHFPSARIQCITASGQHTCDGTLFEMLDQAMYDILRDLRGRLPIEAVREALVNAACHRDYASNQSIQVRLTPDRLEIRNPGAPDFSPDRLAQPHGSHPPNPLLAEPLYLAQYRAAKATGTIDIIDLCEKAGLPPPQFQTEDGFTITFPLITEPADQTAPEPGPDPLAHLIPLLRLLAKAPLGTAAILKGLEMKDRNHLRQHYLDPALAAGLIELTIPDKPKNRLQKYRLTDKGSTLL